MKMLYEIGQKPTKFDLKEGEEAYNVKDKAKYTKDKWDNIIEVGSITGDDIRINGTLQLSSNSIRNVNEWRYTSTDNIGAQYIHMKTDRPLTTTQMFSLTFRGHSYQEAKPINTNVVWYNYGATTLVNNVGFWGTHTCGVYKSTDGFAVITMYIASHYYVAFTYDQFTTTQGLQKLTITTTATSPSSTGVY